MPALGGGVVIPRVWVLLLRCSESGARLSPVGSPSSQARGSEAPMALLGAYVLLSIQLPDSRWALALGPSRGQAARPPPRASYPRGGTDGHTRSVPRWWLCCGEGRGAPSGIRALCLQGRAQLVPPPSPPEGGTSASTRGQRELTVEGQPGVMS